MLLLKLVSLVKLVVLATIGSLLVPLPQMQFAQSVLPFPIVIHLLVLVRVALLVPNVSWAIVCLLLQLALLVQAPAQQGSISVLPALKLQTKSVFAHLVPLSQTALPVL